MKLTSILRLVAWTSVATFRCSRHRNSASRLSRDPVVADIGAGTGSYEPPDRFVVAVEPAWQMIRQRGRHERVVCGVAEALPFPARTFDAGLAILTLHHWTNWRR